MSILITNRGKKMKTLILKGLGKAKVRGIIKRYLSFCFNEHFKYSGGQFVLHTGCFVEGYGLPEMDDGNEFTFDELLEFVGGKI